MTLKVHVPPDDPVRMQRMEHDLKKAGFRRWTIFASGALGLVILGTWLANRNAGAAKPAPVAEIVDHLDSSELSALPEPLRAGAQAIMAGNYQPPAWRQDLDRPTGATPMVPSREAVEEVNPVLEWIGETRSANVAVMDASHHVVARTEVFNTASWTVSPDLEPGGTYTWEMASLGQVSRSHFHVLDETEAGWLEELREGSHRQSHFLLGMALMELGVLTPAQKEFEQLVKEHPHSPEAPKLLRLVEEALKQ